MLARIAEAPPHAVFAVVLFVVWAVAEGTIHLLGWFQPERPDRRRAALTWLQTAFAGSLLAGCADALLLGWTTWVPAAMAYGGVLLTAIGIVIRIVARVQIGRNFSAFVQTTDSHRLITSGLYAWVRHPAYSGFVLFLIGFPLAFGSVAALVIATAVGLPALAHRIRAEEAALESWFGEDYRHYRTVSWRLIPGVW